MSTNKNFKQPMSTEVEFLYERSNATSPEVQFLGEQSNRVPEYFLEKWPSEYMKNIWNKNVIKKIQAADSARKLHLSERLNFPALYDEHWFVFAVDIKTRNFLFLDSLFGERSTLHQKVDDMLIANFRKTWNECNPKDMHFENYGRVFPYLPKQKTPKDCGAFTIKYMQKYYTRNPQSCSFSSNDIPESCIRIAIDTLFNDYNSNIAEMDFISTFDLQAYKNRTIGP
uniref:Uncharacterized protein n=1 Tax=Avena sativa TaxID=4498 RepID=A0ACD5V6I3_AVESA